MKIKSGNGQLNIGSLQKGLVGHWTMSQDSLKGSLLADKTPYENDGTIYGATFATDRMGQANKAMSFDGVNNYVDCQNNFGLDIKDEITINLWIKINKLDNQYRAIIEVLPHYPIKQTNSNQIRFQIKTIDGLNAVYFTAPQIETWYHLALSYSKNDPNGLIAYINGVKIGNKNTYSGQMSSISSTWKIGGPRSSPTLTFDGSIDDVRIYNRVLSEPEIKTLYNSYNPKIKI